MVMSPDLQPNKCTKLGHMFEVNFATLTNVRRGKTNHIGSDNQCAIYKWQSKARYKLQDVFYEWSQQRLLT